ncbi:MAG TPA: flavin reductase family protein [Bradyrhizobium sp.]|nr:flavin reductase family protein [Bradyrhizobium sp.]
MDLRSDFRLGMRRLASGVSIVATADEDGPKGFLATSVSSVALDPTPCLLVCVNKSTSSHDALLRTQVFSVNVLAEQQVDIARRFSSSELRDARFEGSDWGRLETGAPICRGALANFDCRLMTTMTVQTHTVLIGRAVAVQMADAAVEPLIYYDGRFDRNRAA